MLLPLTGVGKVMVVAPVVLVNTGVPFVKVGATIESPFGPMVAGVAVRLAVGA